MKGYLVENRQFFSVQNGGGIRILVLELHLFQRGKEIPMDPQYLGRGHSLCVLESSPMELTAINASFEVPLVFLLRHLITHPWKGLLVFQPSPYIALKHNKGWF